jgi:UDP-N-acetylglucosamine 2-epimerase (non-hydrolysing)
VSGFVVHLVAAARPNLMKVAPLWWVLKDEPWCRPRLVHTGQHRDAAMAGDIMAELGLPAPHVALGVAAGTHGETIGRTIEAYDRVLAVDPPDLAVVVGDVHATLAAAIAARHRGIPLAHLEAGLRSFDRGMPEEVNRTLADHAADILWTTDATADANLRREGIDPARIECVGDTTIDTLEAMRAAIAAHPGPAGLGLAPNRYGVVTLHRPANVDRTEALAPLLAALAEVARDLPLVFPVHPRTARRMAEAGLALPPGVRGLPPLGYVAFLALVAHAAVVITDSGGVQEEASHLGIACVTLRPNTERPDTITRGTNRLADAATLVEAVRAPRAPQPPRHDGRARLRVAAAIRRLAGAVSAPAGRAADPAPRAAP